MAKTKTIENLFISVDLYASLLPVLVFLLHWKQSKQDLGLTLLVVYSLMVFVTDRLLILNNSVVYYQYYTILEFLFFAGFLYIQINSKRVRKAIIGSAVFFTLFGIIFPLLWHGQVLLDSIPIGVETIIILLFAFCYLYERMNDTTTLFIYSTYPFWMVIGIVLYLSGSFFTYILASSLPEKDVNKYWIITNIFSIIKNILFAVAIVVHAKPSKKLPIRLDFGSLN